MMPERSQHLHTRNEVMKPAHIFRDQVNTVAQWFDQWNDIEQTIACYSLLKRIGHTQARFLSLVLEHTFRDSAYEVNILEREANGKEFLKSLCRESKEIAVQQLLLHLPLLHPGNDEARHEYLKLLPKILSHSLEYSIHEEECRQLLSLALVHPAFVPEERNSLTWWLGLIEEKGEKASRPPPGFHQPLTGTKSCQVWGNQQTHQPLKSSLSYKLPQHNGWKEQVQLAQKDSGIGTSFDNSTYTSTGASTNFENTHDDLVRMRSKSFPENPHMPISPQSSLDSDEEAALRRSADALANFPSHPGMKDIPMWLKSLRLHKYADIFGDVTYEDMLAFNDDYLEKHGVTKGARNKIILCINKLKDRKQTLERLETEVLQIGKLPHVLAELKNILVTPIKPPEVNMEEETNALPENGDALLPAIITRVMGKACTQILVTQPDEDCCLTYLGLLERVLSHEAFVHLDKSRLQSWKAQCQKLARDLATNRKLAKIEKPRNWFDTLNYGAVAGRRRVSNQNSLKRDIPRGPLVNPQHKKLAATNSYHPSLVNQVNNHHAALNRTKSAPIRSGNVTFAQPGLQDTEEINKSLETLGLSMTNHALEDTSETKMTEEELF